MDFEFLTKIKVFKGIDAEDLQKLFDWLGYDIRQYSKGDAILMAGDKVSSMGIVLAGSANIESNDVWGNKSIFDNVASGQVFAEVYACANDEELMVDVVANESCKIVFLKMSKLFDSEEYTAHYQDKFASNLLKIMSLKNLNLSRKIYHVSFKSIRGRIVSYLSYLSRKLESKIIEIPYNRQQLSDYLCVDRSALSNELSKMQKEGLIKYNKNKFEIISEYDFEI